MYTPGWRAETLAITKALLAVSAAVVETRQALLLLTPAQSDEFVTHLQSSNAAMDRCLAHIQELLALIDKGHG
jgi:hypothetical protein